MQARRGARLAIWLAAGATCVLASACGGPAPLTCPDGGTTLTYDGFGREFLATNCNYCHAATVTNRQGAPSWITFDTLSQVIAWRERIAARATGDRPSMPPGPTKPAPEDRQRLAEWLGCAPP